MADCDEVLKFMQGDWINAENPSETYVVTGRSVWRTNDTGSRNFPNVLFWQEKWRKLCWGPKSRYYIDPPRDPHNQEVTWHVWQGGRGFRWRRPGKSAAQADHGEAIPKKVVLRPRSPEAKRKEAEPSDSLEPAPASKGPQAKKRLRKATPAEVAEDGASKPANPEEKKQTTTQENEGRGVERGSEGASAEDTAPALLPDPAKEDFAIYLGGEPGWQVERLIARRLLSAGFRPKPDPEDEEVEEPAPSLDHFFPEVPCDEDQGLADAHSGSEVCAASERASG
eukprot:gb/GFBE01036301.1/.p1 GENE.gb/GFBE01036301.1/~~gb/GFBE01036301.1/.p1  ORF type:complete len:282 (+),score=56.64 gb/GFBE01036301.1/:1-846(+)